MTPDPNTSSNRIQMEGFSPHTWDTNEVCAKLPEDLSRRDLQEGEGAPEQGP